MRPLSTLLDGWRSKNPAVERHGAVIICLRAAFTRGGIKTVRRIAVSEGELTVVLAAASEMALVRYLAAGCLKDSALRLNLKVRARG